MLPLTLFIRLSRRRTFIWFWVYTLYYYT